MSISIDEFLQQKLPALDVRSPAEYAHAKIPGALSLALFSDAERALVGTAYKKQGKKEAIDLGVQIVGPKLWQLLQQAQGACQEQCQEHCTVYCWRGGMRSEFVRFFLAFTGMRAVQLEGGYKAFRRKMLWQLSQPTTLLLLGGLTGSGKTEVLHALGGNTIDLEAIACHRGSVYGELLGTRQPSNEQFENELALALYNAKGTMWVEDESRLIGSCKIPDSFYERMQQAPLFVLECSKSERIARIIRLYGHFPKNWWIDATQKIRRRLGGAETSRIIRCIEENSLERAIDALLHYYDAAYSYAMQRRKGPTISIDTQGKSVTQVVNELLSLSR